ncbi:hypothetical protein tb265_12050 [Gemmatimonadetes bacterium T265]|nr:hypothetical protein tb265_12050 [Gemmatimonadetes bacterium T265]
MARDGLTIARPTAAHLTAARVTAARLRAHVVRRSLFAPTTLAAAVARLGFVQADPIRAPARAQDLILRHRVAGYRAGDLERAYPALGLDEDVLYAYGFVTPEVRALLHPGAAQPPGGLAGAVLAYVQAAGPVHPADVAARFAAGAERNAWGGLSRASTRALEHLHVLGLVRVARRDQGVRVYEAAATPAVVLSPAERLRGLVLWLADLFAPLPEAALRRVLRYVPFVRREVPAPAMRAAVGELLRTGALEAGVVDGATWVWPAAVRPHEPVAAPRAVRFLAPFDPVVWDRARFEQLWGWAYRFEAYTPAARRERGYYALPVLWGDRVVGWANVARRAGRVDVALGFVGTRPRGAAFGRALDAEVARVEAFLAPR